MTEIEILMLTSVIDNDIQPQTDAIIILQGDGLYRVNKAIELYKTGRAPILVYSGASENYDNSCVPFNEVLDLLFQNGIPENSIIHESISQNTHEQAVEVIRLCKKKKWKRITLVASPYHQYRAYLTFLCESIKSYSDLLIFNSPASGLCWNQNDVWGTRLENLKLEIEKVDRYSQYGHIASFSDALDYQKKKENIVLKVTSI